MGPRRLLLLLLLLCRWLFGYLLDIINLIKQLRQYNSREKTDGRVKVTLFVTPALTRRLFGGIDPSGNFLFAVVRIPINNQTVQLFLIVEEVILCSS